MSIAAKHFDPLVGIDTHITLVPTPAGPVPTPLPQPYVGMIFDVMDYVPVLGTKVFINGLPRAQAGTAGQAMPPHLPLAGPFAKPPTNESEVFMGSSTVLVEGEPQSYFGLPALSCQDIGMPAPPRVKRKSTPKSLLLPTTTVLSIPMGSPVLIGGAPTISMASLGTAIAMGGLKKLAKLGPIERRLKAVTERLQNRATKLADKLADKLGLGDIARNRIHRALCTVTGHPVDVATGKMFTDAVDLELPGPLPLRWERVWYSTSSYRGPLGHGWHHSYDVALHVEGEGLLLRHADGRFTSLPKLAGTETHYDRAEKLTLRRDGEGYVVERADGTSLCFAERGVPGQLSLISQCDTMGNTLRFEYDRGQLTTLVDSSGRRFTLRYRGEHLVAIEGPHPDAPERRVTFMSYDYDAHGDLTGATDALGHRSAYRYQRHLMVQETNRNGLSFYFEYDQSGPGARCTRTWGDGGIYDHKISYDVAQQTTVVENSLGQKTTYHHDGALVLETRDALGHRTQTHYDDDHQIVATFDALGLATRYAYDERGHLSQIQNPDGTRIQIKSDEHGRPVETTDTIGGSYRFSRDSQGRVLRRNDPLGRVTQYHYDAAALIGVTDPAGGYTRLGYDDQGNLTTLTTPDGASTHYAHDALGRVTAVTDPKGNRQERRYDLLHRVIEVREPDGNTRQLAYDPEGNVTEANDLQHHVTFVYQGLGRLQSRTENDTRVGFEYDTEERLVAILNEHGHAYRFTLGATGHVDAETGFDGLRRRYTRDVAGRVTRIDRPGERHSIYTYDPAGRVTRVDYSDGSFETYKYRADGQLLEAKNQDAVVGFKRDPLGRVLEEAQGPHTIQTGYDARGLRTHLRSSLGADLHIQRSAMGDVESMLETQSTYQTQFKRDALGLELERALPGGIRSLWQRDALGRPRAHTIHGAARAHREVLYTWQPSDRLQALTSAAEGTTQYIHDPLGNLASARYPDRSLELRLPDAVGNLYKTKHQTDRKYGPAGQILSAQGAHGTTHYAYDPEGNLIRKTEPQGRQWHYAWNGAGMLASVTRPDGTEVAFKYDALGRRTQKTYRGQTTHWVWDGNVPLHEWVEGALERLTTVQHAPTWAFDAEIKKRDAELQQYLAQGPPEGRVEYPELSRGSKEEPITWLFEPETFAPMAKLVGGSAFSIVTDHLGTPVSMLDGDGAGIWSAEISTYGELRRLHGRRREQPSARYACPFRFPGQYEDAETGLYYNRFRYFDPEVGGYVSQDPIGLRGGTQMHSYVADPLRLRDPLGLSCEGQSRGRMLPSPKDSNPWMDGATLHSSTIGPEGLIVYRAHGAGRATGAWVTLESPATQRYVREQLAVHPDWNEASHVSKIRLAPGTQIQSGVAGPQNFPGGTGGGHQIQVLNWTDIARQDVLETFVLIR